MCDLSPCMSPFNSALDVRILPLREEDISDLVRLARDIWYAHYPSIITIEQIEYMLDQRYRPDVIREQLANCTAWWDKLLLDGAMVAFASCELGEHPDAMKVDKVYVRYDLRGRGYGSLLLRHVEEARAFSGLHTPVSPSEQAQSLALSRRTCAMGSG